MSFVVSAAALGVLSYGPAHQINEIFHHPYIQPLVTKHGATIFFGVTAAFSLVRYLNKALSTYALNNWRIKARGTWHWPSEVAVVTGGCGGIGKQLVLGLRGKGVKIVILDMLPLPAEFEGNPSILYIKTDITSPASIEEAAQKARETFGTPTILINNAGIATPHTILDTPPEYLPKIFGVNAIALWLTTQAFLPAMIKENKGHILNMGSVTAYMALPSMVDYCASKAAALTFHEGLNCELKTKHKADGVITTLLQPGWVRTPMSPQNADDIERTQGKMLRPEEVAEAALEYIWSRRGGQVILPGKLGFFSTLKGWPNWAQELLRDAMGRASLL
ncbi:hypothetical protein ACHAQA_006065 [Verticillium albo-atrum]